MTNRTTVKPGRTTAGIGGFLARFLRSSVVVPAAAGLTALLALPAPNGGYVWDDLVQRDLLATAGPGEAAMRLFRFVDPVTRQQPFTRDMLPWWTAPDLRLSFWRPLSALTHWADARLLSDAPRAQRLHSIG